MAFTSGTATDYIDLLNKLSLYVVSQGWTELYWTPGTVAAGGSILQLKGPGAGIGREVYLEFDTLGNPALSQYYWRMWPSTAPGYVAYPGYAPGSPAYPAYFNIWQNAISYWFYVNDRRIVVVAKCSTAYISMYAGFFLPFSQPQNYPFPLYTSGDYHTTATWSLSRSGRRMFCDPGTPTASAAPLCSAAMRNPGGLWLPVANHLDGTGEDQGLSTGRDNSYAAWPYSAGSYLAGSVADINHWGAPSGAATSSGDALNSIVPTRQGERWLWPVTLVGMGSVPAGVLDGVYCVPGQGIATEQQITIGTQHFRVFQNILRASGNDFFAVEEI
jgi:hypothetical protein